MSRKFGIFKKSDKQLAEGGFFSEIRAQDWMEGNYDQTSHFVAQQSNDCRPIFTHRGRQFEAVKVLSV